VKYLSVFSGIEAATMAWHGLGWEPVGFAEIDPFPAAVLEHHYPDIPNYGDVTKYKEWDIEPGSIDILVGGSPCQAFSIAGLRKGLDDPRGNLMLTYGAIAGHFKPRWIVWENVPGVLSTNNGDDFRSFLDMLEELGYVCDIEILDAQWHGLAQRRRRVFVCGIQAKHILKLTTNTSLKTIMQFLSELSQKILAVANHQYNEGPEDLEYIEKLNNGIRRRMKLFGLLSEKSSLKTLLKNLDVAVGSLLADQKNLDLVIGGKVADFMRADLLMDLQMESQSTHIVEWLKNLLEESLKVAKSYITSTQTRKITESEIYTFSKLVLLIGRLIYLLKDTSLNLWSAALSNLTAMKEYTNYARQTSSELFGDMERNEYWVNFIGEAQQTIDSYSDIRVSNFGEVFSITESLRGDSPPSRKAGKGITHDIAPSLTASGRGTERTGDTRGQDAVVAVAHTLRGEGFDASEDGTGRGTPLIAQPYEVGNWPAEVGSCLNANFGEKQGLENQHINQGAPLFTLSPIPITDKATRHSGKSGKGSGNGLGIREPGDPVPQPYTVGNCLTQRMHKGINSTLNEGQTSVISSYAPSEVGPSMGASGPPYSRTGNERVETEALAITSHKVRRLTPRECERLQGFPDVENYDIIHLWSENQKKSVNVETQSLKRPKCAGNVEKTGLSEYAQYVAQSLDTKHQQIKKPVALNVRINLEGKMLEILSQKKSRLNVNTVVKQDSYRHHIPIENFALLNAIILIMSEKITQIGKAASLDNRYLFTHQKNGKKCVHLSGQEISENAKNVEKFIAEQIKSTKYTTSRDGLIHQNQEWIKKIWFSFVINVISGFIPEKIQKESFFTIKISIRQGYTQIPWRGKDPENCPDGPRYKALGNSMAVNVMQWIGQRIQNVDYEP
jgi:DNA-cytosine methyltransferase